MVYRYGRTIGYKIGGKSMEILVLNGSPKGKDSVTMQYIKFIQKMRKECGFKIVDISKNIKNIEKNENEFNSLIDDIENADLILWAFPVYHFSVPAQYKRFIELIEEREKSSSLKNKYASVFMSSINFFDTMAKSYMQGVIEDFDMKYCEAYLANMYEMKDNKKREDILFWFDETIKKVEQKRETIKRYKKSEKKIKDYLVKNIEVKEKTENYNILLISDDDRNQNLKNMIDVFENRISANIKKINLKTMEIKGACLGCINCGYDGECIYNDELSKVYKEDLINADAIVIAASIKDRYFSSEIKRLWDRSFLYGHRAELKNKQILYIISGELTNNDLISKEIEARANIYQQNLLGVISDELEDNDKITKLIEEKAEDMIVALKGSRRYNSNFYHLAGSKIFRDFIYCEKAIFVADHKFYKKTGVYDFPQKDIIKRVLSNLLYGLMKIKGFRKVFKINMRKGMIAKLEGIINNIED